MLRNLIRWGLVAGTIGIVALGVTSNAFATSITQPASQPFAVPGSISATLGSPQAFNVVASGFTPGQNVYIEQCDGIDPATPTWSVSIDCDFGMSPGPAIAGGAGNATFAGTGNNFQAFRDGRDAQNKFNCVNAADRPINPAKPSYTTCRIRVSSNNASATGDQAFLTFTMPSIGAPSAPTIGTASSGAKGKATVTWTAPSNTNGSPVTGYLVTPIDSGMPQTPVQFNSTATTETVSGLVGGDKYTFKVAAINARGTGVDSGASNQVTIKSK